ncbi:MAG: RecQ family ATP-dependent DNA helicase, partial [Myxococcota bacterium]
MTDPFSAPFRGENADSTDKPTGAVDEHAFDAALERFGYAAFRIGQREAIETLLREERLLLVAPTGGGKSLIYQLPAALLPGTSLVISPLISLMADQVAALDQRGVAATFLASTLGADEMRSRMTRVAQGRYDLVYVAPERLSFGGFRSMMARVKCPLIAIDEAHCISEWGHDFRPEYRQIANLRDQFGQIPMMALTATATDRVREDIATQLRLHEPQRFIASFNRPNLQYRVTPRRSALRQILEVASKHEGESGIIYCGSRNGTERLAQRLTENGVKAAPYHAGMNTKDRNRNQEAFIRDEIQVICATIAFGMGIDKPDVRFVIHQDLPKNLEGYYQETGRAGRDGLSADCVLLFNAADVTKQTGFIEEKPDEHERTIARNLLQQMVHYAESRECRGKVLLDYFSETYDEENCGACDNCLEPKETFEGTESAQKFLACIFRVHQKTHFNVGLNHIVDVLCGGDNEKIRRWNHQELSTYNIGTEFGRDEWKVIGRELVRLGLAFQTPGQMSVIELTEQGAQW